MIYLSGCVRPELLAQPDMGVILTPRMGNAPDLGRSLFAIDNGCFSKPESFDLAEYEGYMARWASEQDRRLFVTAPDVVGDAAATLARSLPVLPVIRAAGYRAALVAQDGLEGMGVPWDAFDCLFVGGTTSWKLSEAAYTLAREADERGKWTHMGRVNSWRRLKAAAVSGYDSADGTYIAFGPDLLMPRVQGWLATIRREPSMELGGNR